MQFEDCPLLIPTSRREECDGFLVRAALQWTAVDCGGAWRLAGRRAFPLFVEVTYQRSGMFESTARFAT